MISREEKNKVYVDEIKKEKAIKITKIFFKTFTIVIIIFTLLFLYSYFYEPNSLVTHEYVISDISIPYEYNGIKILHFTDLLYGKEVNEKKLNSLIDEFKLINPDLIIYTGNTIYKDYPINENDIKLLNSFFNSIPYTIGKYAVIGDTDTRNFDLIMENTNFTIINNELIEIYNDIDKINLIGISHNDNKEINNNNDGYTITIINNYDEFNKYNIKTNLVFAGHNLGGEINFFDIPLLGLDKHLNSYYDESNYKVYISNGIGSIHHLRFMNKPSINVYRLYNK